MDELLAGIEALVKEERESASRSYGDKFHSLHEAYAVILEEVEEAEEQREALRNVLHCLWAAIKANRTDNADKTCESIKSFSMHAAAEWIQVAAMAEKGKLNAPPF